MIPASIPRTGCLSTNAICWRGIWRASARRKRRPRNSRPSLPMTLATCRRTSNWPARMWVCIAIWTAPVSSKPRSRSTPTMSRRKNCWGHLVAVGNPERAAAEFHQLLTFAPQDYEAHFGLGLIAAHQGKTAEAAEHFTRRARRESPFRRGALPTGLDPGSAKAEERSSTGFSRPKAVQLQEDASGLSSARSGPFSHSQWT